MTKYSRNAFVYLFPCHFECGFLLTSWMRPGHGHRTTNRADIQRSIDSRAIPACEHMITHQCTRQDPVNKLHVIQYNVQHQRETAKRHSHYARKGVRKTRTKPVTYSPLITCIEYGVRNFIHNDSIMLRSVGQWSLTELWNWKPKFTSTWSGGRWPTSVTATNVAEGSSSISSICKWICCTRTNPQQGNGW